ANRLWLLAALWPCWSLACPPICRCTPASLRCTRDTQLASGSGGGATRSLQFIHLPLTEVQSGSFEGLLNVSRIEISQSDSIRMIRSQAFISLRSLAEISILNINQLVAIESGAFTDLPKLRYLSICNTAITQFPDLNSISSQELYFFLEMGDNLHLDGIPSNAFRGMSEEYVYMNLVRNGFKEIRTHAFNGTKLDKLVLKGNKRLCEIHEDAFEGATGPSVLDVSSTALRALPARGLRKVKVLMALSTPSLKTLPPLENFQELHEAQLTYPSHCCAFHSWRSSSRYRRGHLLLIRTPLAACSKLQNDAVGLYDVSFQYPDLDLCADSSPIKCTPEPDAFNPCEDLLGYAFLRSVTWIITVFAMSGNLTVLFVLLSSHQKLTVSRFLMCNLAFADLCMGLYLLIIAFVDFYSRQEYYNHATAWQTGAGCHVAGFLTVFASELSVYTLTLITLERWHTITHAMRMDRRLRLRHVLGLMAAGWGFSGLVALLPVLGVSSYTKVSMCLPMDIETAASQGYVVAVLLLNVAAFLVVCYCYGRIYARVRNPEVATRRGDAKIAKRMAVLIFTDFLCMAPISFFAISAALNMPLITVSHSKILLVLFYPINSLCNPFLYTIFTRACRRDVCLFLSRCKRHAHTRAGRGQGRAAHAGKAKRKDPSRKPHSLQFYTYHIKMQGCFLSRAGT
uniref:Thyrotropin receptor n=1 Tax=Denticeps clupeoides TaxID=299321 RepID=A0AAY4CWE4_9TELE